MGNAKFVSNAVRCWSLLFVLVAWNTGPIAQGAKLRVAGWNTFNRPNNAEQQTLFSTVLQAIGEETVAGVAQRIDVLAVSETDTGSARSLADLANEL